MIRVAPTIDTKSCKPSECDHLSVRIIGGMFDTFLRGHCVRCGATVTRYVTAFERETGRTEIWWHL